MKGLIGKKLGMTQIYDGHGDLIPVTVLQAGPCTVLDVKTKERGGYSAIQLGFGGRKAKNVSKAVRGHCRVANLENSPPAEIKEIRMTSDVDIKTGSLLKADIFSPDEYVDIVGTVKGRGFQGVVKRYNFAGGRYSHGGGWKRKPGSVGQKEHPARVDRGKKMPGHMGNVRRTIQNLCIVKVVPEENLILVRGAVPGPNNGILLILSALKKSS